LCRRRRQRVVESPTPTKGIAENAKITVDFYSQYDNILER